MWNDIYLRLPDEAAWLADALENNTQTAVDVLGVVQNWFLVNLRLRDDTLLPAPLAAHVIAKPEFPQRVFADMG